MKIFNLFAAENFRMDRSEMARSKHVQINDNMRRKLVCSISLKWFLFPFFASLRDFH